MSIRDPTAERSTRYEPYVSNEDHVRASLCTPRRLLSASSSTIAIKQYFISYASDEVAWRGQDLDRTSIPYVRDTAWLQLAAS